MNNLLLESVEYKINQTQLGTWRRYLSPTGAYFAEFKSKKSLFGLPLIHYTRGICPETGRRKTAKGIISIGRIAVGIVALGQASFGIIAIGQLAIGLLFGFGQGATGIFALGQLAVGLLFGAGQIATGVVAIGQMAFGKYVLAQVGVGEYVWSQKITDPAAVDFFKSSLNKIMTFLTHISHHGW